MPMDAPTRRTSGARSTSHIARSTSHIARSTWILLLFAVASAGCDIVTADHRYQETAEWRKSYELAPGGRFEVVNINGQIQVEPASGNTLEVVALKTARGNSPEDAKRALERLEVTEQSNAGTIRIETRYERSGWFGPSAHVRYTIRLPKDANARFVTTNGGVELRGVSGTLEAQSTNGGIVARDVGGSFSATTTNGGVDVDMSHLGEGGARFQCTNGGVRLRLPSDAKATISATVTNGGIDTGNLPLETTESSRRRLEARLNGGGPPVRMSCTNGGLSIHGR